MAFYETGEPPRKNLEVMKEAVVEVRLRRGGGQGPAVGGDVKPPPDPPWRENQTDLMRLIRPGLQGQVLGWECPPLRSCLSPSFRRARW